MDWSGHAGFVERTPFHPRRQLPSNGLSIVVFLSCGKKDRSSACLFVSRRLRPLPSCGQFCQVLRNKGRKTKGATSMMARLNVLGAIA
jgi:hypothetical protein